MVMIADIFLMYQKKKLGEEVVKRINMHDELVKSLHDMVEIVGSNFCQNMEIKQIGRAHV